ncbi:MAG: YecA family protein [Methanobacteriota archaeon]
MGKTGRNDPCSCGSGLKYKRCCMGEERLAVVREEPPPGFLTLTPELEIRVAAVESLFDQLLVPRLSPGEEELDQCEFEEWCQARWLRLASGDSRLAEACEILRHALEADKQQRKPALVALQTAGEAGVPYSGVLLHEPAWCSILAIQALVVMPKGPLRNRGLVEALFVSGDWVPDTAIQNVRDLSEAESWSALEAVANEAAGAGIELQSSFWTGLFTDEGGIHFRPRGRMGDALRLLYTLGHRSAARAGLEQLLDPMLDGPESVGATLEDAGVRSFLGELERELRFGAPLPA